MLMNLDVPLRTAHRHRAAGRSPDPLRRFVELPLTSPTADQSPRSEDAILDLALCLILAATIVGLLMLHL